jgi:hypothetical protein
MICSLADNIKTAYREGKLNDGQALEICRLSPEGDQQQAFTYVKKQQSWGGRILSVSDLKTWIEETFFDELAFQPWLKSQEAMAAVGECKECPKETNTLFGEVKEGACTTLKCYRRKMKKYIDWMKEKTPGLVLVSTMEWGHTKAGVLGRYDYNKAAKNAKNFKPALVVQGKNRGKVINVTISKEKVLAMTPEEKKAHDEKKMQEKIEREKREAAERAREERKMNNMLKNITYPLKEKHLDPLLDIALNMNDGLQEIAKRRKLEGKVDEDGDYEDPEKAVRVLFSKADTRTKMQIIIEVFIGNLWGGDAEKIMKKFN